MIRLSAKEFENSCHLNLYDSHFSYISKFKSYAKKYQCSDCNRFISRSRYFARHKITCKATEIKGAFVGGKYIVTKTVFEELEELEIKVPKQDLYDPFFSTFDFEAFTW